MLYREMGKTGDQVSILGYGCMRFPRADRRIDEKRTEAQIITAIEQGVNYFDTAYVYPGSEVTLGKILSKGYRDKVLIATKMPLFMIHSAKDMEATLDTQLKRLQTDHIDYYLMHSINSMAGWQRIKELGVEEFLLKAKEAGKINRIGFSYHGEKHQFKNIVDDYPWEFCQIQYNYMDEQNQAGKEGLSYAASKGLGISIMEPLRGGLLARKMPEEVQKVLEEHGKERTPAEWALRWVWNHPEVSLLLSGMNEESQIEENIRIADSCYPGSMTEEELETIQQAKEILTKKVQVKCTGCGYCLPCPAGVNIPVCFGYYNDKYIYNDSSARTFYMGMLSGADGGKPSYASLCLNCGKCEKHCPQHLPIRRHLKDVSKEMEKLYFKPAVGLLRGYYYLRGGLGKKSNK
ncbi:aldo/keto reductase [Sinanaerobacter chloroacetimidivorans]|uniref:aldo/keto reductase n=1 Tax=Sinanaerobacter chloroacetimidivorans TaxID=2818044 RepID=UPI001D038980|nr:aldo/keto reductase [Sinanaerobacter chloroacetimidivorans]